MRRFARAALVLLLVIRPAACGAGVPYVDTRAGVAMTLPDGWGMRVAGPGAQAKQFGPMGDPEVTLMVNVTSLAKGKPLDTAQVKAIASKSLTDTGAKLKEVPWEVKIPGVTPTAWGYNFKPSDGKLYAMRMAVFLVPDGDRESLVQVQAIFLATKAPAMKANLPGIMASFKFAGVAPVDPGLRDVTEQQACRSNQKTISGAAEMWSLDKNKKWDTLTPELLRELEEGQYLGVIPDDPGQPPGSSTHYYKVPGSTAVACKVHGDVEGKIAGTKARVPEIPDPPLDHVLYRAMKGEIAATHCKVLVNELSAGLSMYRIDTSKFDQSITPEVIAEMFRRGWLRRVMTTEDPGEGAGSEKNFSSDGSAVSCSKHGTKSK